MLDKRVALLIASVSTVGLLAAAILPAPPLVADTYRIPVTPSALTALSGNLELRDNSSLAAESLNETDFATNVKWTAAGDFAFAGAKAVYTDAAHTGTITQTSANGAVAWAVAGANSYYKLTYTTSAVTGTPVCTVPATFALAAQTLTISPATTYTVYIKLKAASVGDFVISCASAAAATVSFDDVSLKQVTGGTLTANGEVLAGNGTAAAVGVGFLSHPGDGLFYEPSNGLGLSAAGTGRWYVNATGFYPATTDATPIGSSTKLVPDAFLSRSVQGSKAKALTDAAAATAFVTVAVPTDGQIGGELIWVGQSVSGADHLVANGSVRFWGAATGATPVCGINKIGTDGEGHSGGANTLVCTITNVVAGQTCAVSVTCTNNLAGTQAITFNGRVDMPLAATLVFP